MITIFLLGFFINSFAHAQTFVGTFVALRGDVKILHTPTEKDAGPFEIVEGTKYAYENAKIGKKVFPKEIVQSGTDGKAKIIYPNGDHFLIGNATFIVMPDVEDNAEKKATSSIKLIYGRVRSLISKSGPRNNMNVTTSNAVAGVRGTDFFVRSNPTVGTQLTVLRGEVETLNPLVPDKKVSVKTGYFMHSPPKSEKAPQVSEATKEELMALQNESTLKTSREDLAQLNPEEKKEIKNLDNTAKNAVLNDLKGEDPTLYSEFKNKKFADAEDVNSAVVSKLFQTAPSDKKHKPSREEVESLGKDVYDKYYKNGQEKK